MKMWELRVVQFCFLRSLEKALFNLDCSISLLRKIKHEKDTSVLGRNTHGNFKAGGLKCYWHLWSEKATSNLPDLWPARLLSDCSFTDLNWVPLLAPTLEAFLIIFTVAQRGWEFGLILCGSGSGVVSVLTATASSSLSWCQSILLLYHFVLFVRRWRLALHVNIILYKR